jgi:hypothetical protein
MSTQRREDRWQRSSSMAYARPSEGRFPTPGGEYMHAGASGGTAPLLLANWLATKSLRTDHFSVQFVWLVQVVQLVCLARFIQQDIGCGSPPLEAVNRTTTGTPATYRSSPSRISLPSGSARLHPTLPQIPVCRRSRTERYDGKRDLYFKHTARNSSCNP